MMLDGLEDAYEQGSNGVRRAMGIFADQTAIRYGFSRQDQEAYVQQGFDSYMAAEAAGHFSAERVPLVYSDPKGGETIIESDEPPTRVKPAKFGMLRPAFGKDGTVTAATSSGIADGAAALLLGNNDGQFNAAPLARIVGYVSHGIEPEWFTLAPIGAIQKLLIQIGWAISDVDLFEINEAFAVVPMATMQDLGIARDKMNVFGGACTMGHPIGGSGARVVVTLIHALKAKGLKRGIASVCIGGGEATAIAVEVC